MKQTIFTVLWLGGIVALALASPRLPRQVVAVGSPPQAVVEYNALESAIKISSKVDFANVRVTFDDTPGQSITVKELRDVVKARIPMKVP